MLLLLFLSLAVRLALYYQLFILPVEQLMIDWLKLYIKRSIRSSRGAVVIMWWTCTQEAWVQAWVQLVPMWVMVAAGRASGQNCTRACASKSLISVGRSVRLSNGVNDVQFYTTLRAKNCCTVFMFSVFVHRCPSQLCNPRPWNYVKLKTEQQIIY